MGDETFNENLLTEKLSKLNSSQQSIESVSRWCILHRKKAKQVVETWDSLFKSAARDQRVSFLFLANDILQNSRRKGIEFVNEFWKVLPSALKGVYASGEENCKKVASRLVNIWEERKVFGSRGQNLKNDVLGKNLSTIKSPSPVNNAKDSNPIKIVKRDAESLRIKLAVGGLPEKIITAFQLVHDEMVNEEVALNKCRNVVSCVQELEKDVVNLSSQGNLVSSDVVDNIEKQENMLQQCISQLENFEAIRVALVSQLTEALQDQVSKLELIRSELLAARGQIGQAANTRLEPPTMNHHFMSEEESKKAAAAAMAAKLTSSTSSAEMLTSVLSSLVAEEAASMSTGLKRPRLENPDEPYFPGFTQTNMPPHQANNNPNPGFTFGYGGSNLMPPPPPLGFAMPGPPPPQQAQQQPQQGNNNGGGYYTPIGVGFYGQNH